MRQPPKICEMNENNKVQRKWICIALDVPYQYRWADNEVIGGNYICLLSMNMKVWFGWNGRSDSNEHTGIFWNETNKGRVWLSACVKPKNFPSGKKFKVSCWDCVGNAKKPRIVLLFVPLVIPGVESCNIGCSCHLFSKKCELCRSPGRNEFVLHFFSPKPSHNTHRLSFDIYDSIFHNFVSRTGSFETCVFPGN